MGLSSSTEFRSTTTLLLSLAVSLWAVLADEPLPQPIKWYPCSLYTDAQQPKQQTPNLHGLPYPTASTLHSHWFSPTPAPFDEGNSEDGATGTAFCGMSRQPMEHDTCQPPTEFMNIFVKKIPAPSTLHDPLHASSNGQIYVLNGGPGGAGDALEGLAVTMGHLLNEYDIYLIDHRGTGRSARLGCDVPQAETSGSDGGVDITKDELPVCVDAMQDSIGDDWMVYTITEAAWDVHQIIEVTKGNGTEVIVYGMSYGSLLAQRYLTIFHDHADKVILDGTVSPSGGSRGDWSTSAPQRATSLYADALTVDGGGGGSVEGDSVSPTRFTFDWWDINQSEVGDGLLDDFCGEDSFCSTRLGKQPSKLLKELYSKIANGHCSESGIDSDTLKVMLGSWLVSFELRTIIPAVILRVDRCNGGDVTALAHLKGVYDSMREMKPSSTPLGSPMLCYNIEVAEMWDIPNPSLSDLDTRWAQVTMGADIARDVHRIAEVYPKYAIDRYFNRTTPIPLHKTKVLFLHGSLDSQVPLWSGLTSYQQLMADTKHFVTIPGGVHVVSAVSPVQGSPFPCGMSILASFVRGDGDELDKSCMDDLVPINFDVAKELSLQFFGTSDAYDWNPQK